MGVKQKLSINCQKEIAAKYLAGESTVKLALQFGVHSSSISAYLKRMGVARRSFTETSTRCRIDHTSFSDWNAESEYWAGFLFADGAIWDRDGKTPMIVLKLCKKDAEHISKFKSFLKSTHAVYEGTEIADIQKNGNLKEYGYCRISVYSHEIRNCLVKAGLQGERIPIPHLAKSRHFWRGMVDGDGSLGRGKGREGGNMYLLASEATLELFKGFLGDNDIETEASPYPHNGNPSIYHFGFGAKKCRECLTILYQKGDTALTRKAITAQAITSWIPTPPGKRGGGRKRKTAI